MNTSNMTYIEIQNLRIQAEIKAYATGKNTRVVNLPANVPSVSPKPLPVFIPDSKQIRRSNVDMRIIIRNHTSYTTSNLFLVKESTLVNPDKNIISVESAIGKILNHASIGDNFVYGDNEYTVLDISPTPKTRSM